MVKRGKDFRRLDSPQAGVCDDAPWEDWARANKHRTSSSPSNSDIGCSPALALVKNAHPKRVQTGFCLSPTKMTSPPLYLKNSTRSMPFVSQGPQKLCISRLSCPSARLKNWVFKKSDRHTVISMRAKCGKGHSSTSCMVRSGCKTTMPGTRQ